MNDRLFFFGHDEIRYHHGHHGPGDHKHSHSHDHSKYKEFLSKWIRRKTGTDSSDENQKPADAASKDTGSAPEKDQ